MVEIPKDKPVSVPIKKKRVVVTVDQKNPAVITPKSVTTLEEPKQLVLPAIPIREGVLFPGTESVLTFGRALSVNAIKNASKNHTFVVLITQKDPKTDAPAPEELYQIGTLAIIEKTLQTSDNINALVRGVGRVRIDRFVTTKPQFTVEATKLDEQLTTNDELKALVQHLQKEFRKAVHMGKPVEFLNFMKLMGGVTDGELVDQIASTLSIPTAEKQTLLETLNVTERMKLVIDHLSHEMNILEIEKDVVHKTQEKFDKTMRENILRERLRTIQKELGELEDEEEVADDFEKKLKKLKLDAAITKKIRKEIKRLKQMSPNNPESGYIRSWLDAVFELPWNTSSKTHVDILEAAAVLEENHYGLSKVKDRILEYVAVLQLKQAAAKTKKTQSPTILCFVGPPGVGKTSIGKSIAQALGRKFVKISLGGVRDEAEIRGHRRTYVGAMPGKIINGIKQAGTLNPVFMLDEVDKLGTDFRGDPSAALLEALDPEQNSTFEDHYIDMPFDLSEVIFITTANTLDTIPPALRDRLEIIQYSGYTEDEKFHIAKKYLLQKALETTGVTREQVTVTDATIHTIIQRYTREAGVRSLERTLNQVLRKVARALLESTSKKTPLNKAISPQKLKKYLGPEKFDATQTEAQDQVGLATGLAYTNVGGEVLFIEVALTPGKGNIVLTGKLGDVMKESAQAAFTYVKAHSRELGIQETKLSKTDIHIHVPEGAVPKDGPSAGITITTAIVSAFTNIPIKKSVAMTGEVTLRGRVLRIGGLKEKSIAAHRAGSTTVLIPADNERDVAELPKALKKDITFIPIRDVSEAFTHALAGALKPIT